MAWTMTIRNFGIIALKNALNALIVNVNAWWILPANFNLHNTAAEWNIAKLAGGTIIAREILVWGPVIYKWTQTDAQPSDLDAKLQVAQVATQQASKQADKAADAVADAKDAAAVIEKPKG